MSSYQLDLIGADGKAATETHEVAEATGIGLYIRDGAKETWIPWQQVHVVSITPLDTDVRQPVAMAAVRPVSRSRRR